MSLRLHILPLLLVLAVAGCASESAPQADINRGPIGKADVVGSCQHDDGGDHCGEASGGNCWCDDKCESFGDCCADKAETCDLPGCDLNPELICAPGYVMDDETCDCVPADPDCPIGPLVLCSPNTIWDQEECACLPIGCPDTLCESGFVLDDATCECVSDSPQCTSDDDCAELVCPGGGGFAHQVCDNGQCVMPSNPCGGDVGTCAGACGGESSSGCYCDDQCEQFGDCCDDYQDECLVAPDCVVGGCSGQLCGDANEDPLISTCEWLPSYACYQDAICEAQASGECGWTQTPESESCFSDLF